MTQMQEYAVVMAEANVERIADWLRAAGIDVEPYPDIAEFRMMRCRRGGVRVLLSVSQPGHWAAADDERRDKVVVATIGRSILQFWNIGRENRLRRDIIEVLRPHGWSPPQG